MARTSALLLATLALPLATLAACGQDIVVVRCDAHVDDAATGDPDAGALDGRVDGRDAEVEPPRDGGVGADAASACTTVCLGPFTPSGASLAVRERITLTPQLENPGGRAISFTADLGASRRPGLPPPDVGDIDTMLTIEPSTGAVTFLVRDVPAWFSTTTFRITLRAEVDGVVVASADVDVTVRGNVLIAEDDAIYAVASDGLPARSVGSTLGRLIYGQSFVVTPKLLLLARDGTLVVYDSGAVPERLRRFELSGENVGLGDLDPTGDRITPLVYQDQEARGLAQLEDGRFALVIHAFSRVPSKSAVVLWHEDGRWDRTHQAADTDVRWQSLAASTTTNELLILERDAFGRLIRLDPDTGLELGVMASDIADGWSVIGAEGGRAYVGAEGVVLRVTPQGGKAQVNMLGGASTDAWVGVARYFDGQILAVRDVDDDSANVAVIDDTTKVGWLRPDGVGGATVRPTSVVYLD
ncbi:hypothetical protein L6R52_00550 [Myxococcota bacterium]|nr:hypothetical protein [Myxococcota bacterium]